MTLCFFSVCNLNILLWFRNSKSILIAKCIDSSQVNTEQIVLMGSALYWTWPEVAVIIVILER